MRNQSSCSRIMESGVEGNTPGRLGWEYRYRIRRDDEVFSRYKQRRSCCEMEFMVEIQTNFILKPIRVDDDDDKEEIVDSERFATCVKAQDGEEKLCNRTSYRLFEYWLSPEDSERIIGEVFSFGKRIAETSSASVLVIPIVLSIDVCTVQMEGESLDATRNRLIKPDWLTPLPVWGLGMVAKPLNIGLDLRIFLISLTNVRVEHPDKALSLMESCPVCFCPPALGAQLSILSCNQNHVFHRHCIIPWLLANQSCPLCRFKFVIKRRRDVDIALVGSRRERQRVS